MLVEPQLERRAHEARNQTHRVARIEPLLDLPLKLRIEHFGREHIAGARKHVFWHELDAFGQQRVQFDEVFHRAKQTVAQPAFVGAASTGRNQVDVALAHRVAVFGKCHAPVGALALGKVVAVAVGKTLAFEQRDHRVAIKRLGQVIAQAAFVQPGLGFFGLFVDQGDRHAGHEYGFAAQQMGQIAHGQGRGLEVFAIGPHAHRGAGFAVTLRDFAHLQLFGDVAALKHQVRHRALAVGGGL